MQELEEKVRELEKSLANVKIERNNLQSRNGILEKVAVMREDKVQRLTSFAKVRQTALLWLPPMCAAVSRVLPRCHARYHHQQYQYVTPCHATTH